MNDQNDKSGLSPLAITVGKLRIIWIALVAAQIIACVVVYNMVRSGDVHTDSSLATPMMILAAALCLSGVLGGGFLARQRMRAAAAQTDPIARTQGYVTASILRWATLEGPNLFIVIAYMNTGNISFLIIFVALLLLILVDRPSEERMRRDLGMPRQ